METSDAFSIKLVRDLQVFWTEVRSHVLSSTKITAIMIDSTQLSGSSPSQQPASRPSPALCSRAADAADGLQSAAGRSTTCRSEQTAVWTCSITTQSQGHSLALLSVCPTILLRRGKLTMKHWNIRCMKLWKNLSMRSYFHYVTFFSLVEGFHLSASLSKAPNCVLWQERGRRTHNFVPMWRLTLILTGQWRVLIKFLQQQRQQQQRMMQF